MTPSKPTPPTAAILTLGCKLNLADSEAMARGLRAAGWHVSDNDSEGADAVIVNSCSITRTADRKSRHLVLAARRKAPGAFVALTGCMVETATSATLGSLGADIVARQVDQAELVRQVVARAPRVLQPEAGRAFRTRAFISAQEGCNDVCAFCIVPRTRGRERSKPIAAIVREIALREAEGVNEVVLTGTQLGAYGRDRDAGEDLAGLLEATLRRTSVPRIRLSSIQPQDITGQLLELWQDDRLCRHFHLALQSGSDTVLRRMRRRYDVATYRAAVARLRDAIPGVAVTTDVIAGFPGESAAEFAETEAFSREMAFAAMHVFPYSERPGTAATKLPGKVDEAAKQERVHALIAAGKEMTARYQDQFIGSNAGILWENSHDGPQGQVWDGLTDTYIRVHARSDADLRNKITAARLISVDGDGMTASVGDFDA